MSEQQPEHEAHQPPEQPEAAPEAGTERQEEHEALARDGPRLYVASLTDYNAGLLHGRWI